MMDDEKQDELMRRVKRIDDQVWWTSFVVDWAIVILLVALVLYVLA